MTKKLDIFCHVPRESWFCDRYGAEYNKYSVHNVSHTDLGCDVIWLLAAWCWRQIPEQVLAAKKVVCTIHHEVPWKFDEVRKKDFLERDKFVDLYHVPCEQTRDFVANVTDKPVFIVGYWCNSNIWKQYIRDECKKEFNLSKNSLVVSSFQRDTEGSDLKTPKLEKGPDIFCDAVEKLISLDKNVHVLLNGWRRQYVIDRLNAVNIPYTYIELPNIETVAKMYCATDLYIVGSRVEGGPQAILECAMTKTPIISTNVGMAKDILPDSSIFAPTKDFVPKVPLLSETNKAYINVQKYKIENYLNFYDEMFKMVIGD